MGRTFPRRSDPLVFVPNIVPLTNVALVLNVIFMVIVPNSPTGPPGLVPLPVLGQSKHALASLSGTVPFENTDGELSLAIDFNRRGGASIEGVAQTADRSGRPCIFSSKRIIRP